MIPLPFTSFENPSKRDLVFDKPRLRTRYGCMQLRCLHFVTVIFSI